MGATSACTNRFDICFSLNHTQMMGKDFQDDDGIFEHVPSHTLNPPLLTFDARKLRLIS